MGWGSGRNEPRVESLDTAMNVVIPELDGRIVTVPVSRKESGRPLGWKSSTTRRCRSSRTLAGIVEAQGVEQVPRDRRRIAFIFTNSNYQSVAVAMRGLDAPAF